MTGLGVGTFNTFEQSSQAEVSIAVDAWLEKIDVGGLQEFGGPARHHYLRSLKSRGFDFAKPVPPGSVPPVVWRPERLELIHAHPVLLSHGGNVNHIEGSKDHQGPIHANVCTFRDRTIKTGTKHLKVINIHNYSHWISHPIPSPRFNLAMEAIACVCGLVHEPVVNDIPVYVLGDFNDATERATSNTVKRLKKVGLTGMWQQIKSDAHTHGNISFDSIFSNRHCRRGGVILNPHVGDHKAVWGIFA